MAKDPVRWDTFNPDAPTKPAEPQKPNPRELAWRAKHAPGPALKECDECGAEANPCWSDGTCNFCRDCVPAELRYPART